MDGKINFAKLDELLSEADREKLKALTGKDYKGQLLTIDPKEIMKLYQELQAIIEDDELPTQSKLLALGARDMFDFITANNPVSPSDVIRMIGITINLAAKGYPQGDIMEFLCNKYYETKGKEAKVIKMVMGDEEQ